MNTYMQVKRNAQEAIANLTGVQSSTAAALKRRRIRPEIAIEHTTFKMAAGGPQPRKHMTLGWDLGRQATEVQIGVSSTFPVKSLNYGHGYALDERANLHYTRDTEQTYRRLLSVTYPLHASERLVDLNPFYSNPDQEHWEQVQSSASALIGALGNLCHKYNV